MRVLVLDNRDASTPVLVKALEELEAEGEVRFPDKIDLPGILELRPRRILITPGPGAPEDGGGARQGGAAPARRRPRTAPTARAGGSSGRGASRPPRGPAPRRTAASAARWCRTSPGRSR